MFELHVKWDQFTRTLNLIEIRSLVSEMELTVGEKSRHELPVISKCFV